MKAIGIDIGTTSVCGVLVDTKTGEILKSRTENSDAFLTDCQPWEKIQSVEKIMTVATDILNGFFDEDVAVIGVTGQMHGIVYTDCEGQAVSPLYTWQDERGNLPYRDTTYAGFLKSCSGFGNVTDFYNRENGIRPDAAVSYCTIHDYFVMQLCGLKKPLIHASDAASFGCYHLETNQFDYDCNMDITTDFAVAGTYRGIPVGVAIGDNQASVFSTLADCESVLFNVGTGSQVSVVTDTIVSGEDIETRPYFDNQYLVVGAALCGGRAYSLLKSFYQEILSSFAEVCEEQVYEWMNQTIEGTQKQALTVDTRFAGTRRDAGISGSITNITTETLTPAALTAGVLEGMAEELYRMYLQIQSKRSGIVGAGNGIRKNPALVRVFEEKFGTSMKIPKHTEEAAFGAALFGMVASGICKSAKDAQMLIAYR